MMSLRFTVPAIMIFLSVFLSLANVSGIDKERSLAGSPEIRIIIDQEQVEVSVEPGSDGIARFTGTVYCEIPPSTPPGQYCIVQLMADAGGWPCSNPPSMTFSRNHVEEDYDLSVQVPIEISSSTDGLLSVSGRWQYSPGMTGGVLPAETAMIDILAYSRPQISSVSRNNRVLVGEWCDIIMTLTNAGNADDDITLSVVDVPDGVNTYFMDESIVVSEKESIEVILKFRQSNGAPQTHSITVSARGQFNSTKVEDQQMVVIETTISVRSVFSTPYFIIPLILIVAAGTAISVVLVRKRRKKKVT
ncbi:MAG: choice-of-anchor T family protein [Thermoplasmatota archaeon]